MISKPQGDWYHEDRTVEAARQFGAVASKVLAAGTSGVVRVRAVYRTCLSAVLAFISGFAALASGLIGGNIPISILAGGCSLLLGWVALRNARSAFGPGESNPKPDTASLRSQQDPGASIGKVKRDAETNVPSGGSTICYDSKKLFMRAAKMFAACALLALVLAANLHRNLFFSLLVMAALGFYLWRFIALLLRGADNDLTAISWDDRQIRLRTLSSSRQVPWQSVESVKTMRRVLRLWGLIPLSTTYEMVFNLRHKGSRRKVIIPAGVMTIRPDAANQLITVALRRAQFAGQRAQAGDRPDSSSRKMAAQPDLSARELDPVFARDAAERTQAFGACEAPAVFGRKVT